MLKSKSKILFYIILSALFLIASVMHSHSDTRRKIPAISPITVIVPKRGGRVDWSFTNNLIVHSRYGNDGYYDLWIMKPDGSGAKCLTCNNPGIPSLHNGQPAWHPGGNYIVFQSQDPSLPHTKKIDYAYTQPGHGLHNNLWLTDLNGENFYQLRSVKIGGAILHPCFSRDGSKLLWSEKVGRGKFDWAIMVADFFTSPRPHLENIRSFQPAGRVWYETHEFSIDGTKVLCTVAAGRKTYYNYDIWEIDMETGKWKQLTSSPDVWDEHAHYSPDGKKICWVSSKGYSYNPSRWASTLETELCIMNSDGSNKVKITHFNEPGYPEYISEPVIVSDNSWSPDGKKIVATLIFPSYGRKSARIVIIDLEKVLLREK